MDKEHLTALGVDLGTMPDSSFLLIEHNAQGKKRSLMVKHMNGEVCANCLEHAISDYKKADIAEPTKSKLQIRLKTMAKKYLKRDHLFKDNEDERLKEIKEKLSILKEVREELAKTYADNEHLSKKYNDINTQFQNLSTEKESLSKRLDAYMVRDKQEKEKLYAERLEKLSKKFSELGQNKTVEHLSKLNENVIFEFEGIVNSALAMKGESEKLEQITVPSQSIVKDPVKTVEHPKAAQPNFFAGLANVLTSQANSSTKSTKIKHM